MSKRKVTLMLLSTSAALLAACSDQQSISEPTANRQGLNPAVHYDADYSHGIPARPFLDIGVEASGTLRPGDPIELIVRGRVNVATSNATIKVLIPLVAAAEESNWEEIVLPANDADIAPYRQWRRAFTEGEVFEDRVSLVIARPGYYGVTVAAELDYPYVDGKRVDDAMPQRLWLWIDPSGGRVTQEFDAKVFPPDVHPVPGIRTLISESALLRTVGEVSPQCSPEIMHICGGTPTWKAIYNGHQSLKGVRAEYRFRNSHGGSLHGYATSDDNGDFALPSCQGWNTAHIVVRTVDEAITVLNYTNPVDPTDLSVVAEHIGRCERAWMPARDDAAQLFTNLSLTIRRHSQLNMHRNVRVIATYDARDSNSGYHYLGHRNRIPEPHINVIPTHIRGPWGVFVAAHEYGHMYQDLEVGGLVRFYDCIAGHEMHTRTTLECALGEGFASFYAVLTRGADTGIYGDQIITNHHYFNRHEGGADGARIEGAVAAFLYDLTDGTSAQEPWDKVQMQPRDLMEVILYCQVRSGQGNFEHQRGIDHLIYCLEKRSPYEFVVNGTPQNFFTSRTTRATGWIGSGHVNATAGAIRELWLQDLYRKQQGIGSGPSFSISPPEPPGGSPPPDPPPGCVPNHGAPCPEVGEEELSLHRTY